MENMDNSRGSRMRTSVRKQTKYWFILMLIIVCIIQKYIELESPNHQHTTEWNTHNRFPHNWTQNHNFGVLDFKIDEQYIKVIQLNESIQRDQKYTFYHSLPITHTEDMCILSCVTYSVEMHNISVIVSISPAPIQCQ